MTVEREMPPQSCRTSSTVYFARLLSRFGLICSWFDVFVSIAHSLKAVYVTFLKHVTMRASLGVDVSVSVLRFLLVVLDVRRVASAIKFNYDFLVVQFIRFAFTELPSSEGSSSTNTFSQKRSRADIISSVGSSSTSSITKY